MYGGEAVDISVESPGVLWTFLGRSARLPARPVRGSATIVGLSDYAIVGVSGLKYAAHPTGQNLGVKL